jgi:hypothetical protein
MHATEYNEKLMFAMPINKLATLKIKQKTSVLERTVPTERPLLVSEVSANFCVQRMLRGQNTGSLRL